MPRKEQPPLLRKTPLTDRWVLIVRYKERNGVIEALEKIDVHDEVERVIQAAILARLDDDGEGSCG